MSALSPLVDGLAGRPVAVVGDVMLDHFLIGRVDRISPEAPVPVVQFARDDYRLGGAANVAHNLAALGASARLVGVVGADRWAAELQRLLAEAGVPDAGLVADPLRPTTRKMRIVTSRNQQVARVDHESDEEIAGAVRARVAKAIDEAAASSEAVILSDYRKGVVVPSTIACAVSAGSARRLPVLVDPKVPDPGRYRGVTVITPNHHEAELMTGQAIRTTDDARAAARRLHAATGASVLITWGEHGMWVFDGAREATREAALPAEAREVADVTGAGDTVIAVVALALAAGANLIEAARLANIAAGLVVARFGPASVTGAELAAAVRSVP
jgi:D-beta-D-heptose 7-phosphate kinase/D-beta-D-heptose 1-phosphate adenosyltransferase